MHPFDIQDVNLDYQVIDSGGDGRNTMDVSSSRPERQIADYTNASSPKPTRQAVVVDVDIFALQNAYEGELRRRS